jgi:iron complex transport system substrate-binding protein
MGFPRKIICLTEETVETLYLLGREDLIAGVSEYVERPAEAKKHPQVSQFLRSNFDKITELQPDLVIGFSDIQKEIARELIGRGLNVLITNQRSLEEILEQILLLGRIIGEGAKAHALVDDFRVKLQETKNKSASFPRKPRVYFEEWDHPRLSCIRWVSELIEACGGENIFARKTHSLAKEREVSDEEIVRANPDVIIGCWCGKKVKTESFAQRPGFGAINAIKNKNVYEVSPAIFLQPGPALFVDGLSQLFSLLQKVASSHP